MTITFDRLATVEKVHVRILTVFTKYCIKKGIEAKIHYPIPAYKQKPFSKFKFKKNSFPTTDAHVKKIISFPCDQHLSKKQLDYIIYTVRKFYEG